MILSRPAPHNVVTRKKESLTCGATIIADLAQFAKSLSTAETITVDRLNSSKVSAVLTQLYPEAQEMLKDVYLQYESAKENDT